MRCVALLSGGLDSQLAIRLMQQQDIEVEALNFKTTFTCCQDVSAKTARQLNVPLTVLPPRDDYLDVIRSPSFGYGRGANPCVDCRIYMFRRAAEFMRQVDAQFVISGEVVGQRPMSQKRRDLDIIARQSGLDDLLLRPLSARRLPPTKPERLGWVDREKLHAFVGRGRKKLIALAKELQLTDIPGPSTGCALTEVQFSRKVFDLIEQPDPSSAWDFELLTYGRHYRFGRQHKVIVGRRETENDQLAMLHRQPDARSTALLSPDDFRGPTALLVGPPNDDALRFAGGLIRRYSHPAASDGNTLRIDIDGETQFRVAAWHSEAEQAETLASEPVTKRSRIVRPSRSLPANQTP